VYSCEGHSITRRPLCSALCLFIATTMVVPPNDICLQSPSPAREHLHVFTFVCSLAWIACRAYTWNQSRHAETWQSHGQVMVLTHEDASPEEKLPYMALRCHPLVVKEFFGRAAKRNPPCKPEECIWWWWKDASATAL